MPWVAFTSNFDWAKGARQVVAYKAGMVQLVSQACRDAAVGAGSAKDTDRPAGAPAVGLKQDMEPGRSPAAPPAIRRRRRDGQ